MLKLNMKNIILLLVVSPIIAFSQVDSLKFIQKINNQYGGLLSTTLIGYDNFGSAVAVIGDVDHDGIDDIAVGAMYDDDGPADNHGAVYILILNANGTVKSQKKISSTSGGGPPLINGHFYFGSSIAPLGDLNGDGNVDIAVGCYGGNNANTSGFHGAVYILFLKSDGTVLARQKISNNEGGGKGMLSLYDYFGSSVSCIGDLSGDGLPDLAVTASGDDSGGTNQGAVYILNLDYNGTAKQIQKIRETLGGFTMPIDSTENIGSTTGLGDLDGDGVIDIAIGSSLNDDGGTDRGALWICFMNPNGTIKSQQKISDTEGGFNGVLDDGDNFGATIVGLDDLNGDGVKDIAVTASGDDDGISGNGGAMWILFLNSNGTVKEYSKIAADDSLLINEVEYYDHFMSGLAYFGDRNNDGKADFLIGARNGYVPGYGYHTGEVYITHTEGEGNSTFFDKSNYSTSPFITNLKKYNAAVGEPLRNELDAGDQYGRSVCNIGDIDGDGVNDIAVGSPYDDDGGTNKGAVYIQFLNVDGTIKSFQKISNTVGGFTGTLDYSDYFGVSVTYLGNNKLAVGAPYDDDGGTDRGAVWILTLNSTGTVQSHQKISDTNGNFNGIIDNSDYFGYSLSSTDINKDGINDLIVGAMYDDDGGSNTGAVWVLFLDSTGNVQSHQKISKTAGRLNNFVTLNVADAFGCGVTALGDIDKDGNQDIAVGAVYDDFVANSAGAVYVLMLTDSGTVKSAKKITQGLNGFEGSLRASDFFGFSVDGGYDLDLDGVNDLLIGALGYDDALISNTGIIFVCFLNNDGTVREHKLISATSAIFTGLINGGAEIGKSISIVDYNFENHTANIVIGTRDDSKGGYTGGVFRLTINLYKDYGNDIVINTQSISHVVPFEVNFQNQNYEFTTPSKEYLTISNLSSTQTGRIIVEQSANYDRLEILFDVNAVQISNLRIVTDSLSGGDTLSLDSSLYQIVNGGHELILFQRDTTEHPTDSVSFGFVLEGGLGFSPNGVGGYEVLKVAGLENINSFDLTIKTLGDSTVFATTTKTNFWNGRYQGTGSLVPPGVYKYTAIVNGEVFEGQIILETLAEY
ncbi:MAG: hypothetical protein F9K09_01480 [Flavobacteriales bacterium]|nr:MAG: hypothetical protein F9K09_01480 [Flavobacteriales bacterium]